MTLYSESRRQTKLTRNYILKEILTLILLNNLYKRLRLQLLAYSHRLYIEKLPQLQLKLLTKNLESRVKIFYMK